ncbi:MAG: polysaccharide deacetylase family protein [Flavipsychrobacter sp.]
MNDVLFTNPISKLFLNTARGILSGANGGYILAYHSIKPDLFVEHINILRPDRLVSLSEIVARKVSGKSTKGLFAITVDDGYEDTVPDLCDICAEKEWPITFFPPVDFLNGIVMVAYRLANLRKYAKGQVIAIEGEEKDFRDEQTWHEYFELLQHKMYTLHEREYMHLFDTIADYVISNNIATRADLYEHPHPVTWDFIAKKSKNDLLSFQSHGVTHMPVAGLSDEELAKECIDSKQKLYEVTGKEVKHFCYPYGADKCIGTKAQAIVAQHFDSAVTMSRGRIDKADTYMLPRIPLYNIDTKGRTLLKQLTK